MHKRHVVEFDITNPTVSTNFVTPISHYRDYRVEDSMKVNV